MSNANSSSKQTSVCEELLSFDFKSALKLIEKLETSQFRTEYETLAKVIYNSGTKKNQDSLAIFAKTLYGKENESQALQAISTAFYFFYYQKKDLRTINVIEKSLKLSEDTDNPCFIKLSILLFLKLYARETSLTNDSFNFYKNKFNSYNSKKIDFAWSILLSNLYESMSSEKRMHKYLETAERSLEFFRRHEDSLSIGLKSSYYEIFGIYYKVINKQDSAYKYLKKNINLPEVPYLELNKFSSYLDLGRLAMDDNQVDKARLYFIKAKNHISYSDSLPSLSTFYRFKAIYLNEVLSEYKDAYNNLYRSNQINLDLNSQDNNLKMTEMEVRQRTSEKEKQALKNRNIALGLGGLLLFGSLIFFLIQKNTKRKQLLAEQEKELQVQKVGSLMKEQELASIDAMIEGQEKERQRIANDLHDDLGGMMATVKLHFNTLKDKPSPELYSKTDKLLDEAYQKVRSIAHAKNSGVIAKHGLLKSIKDMAQKVSATGKIVIDVVDHGLDNRLENSLELTIFRIVQELTTNVIKHAHASEMIIHLTQHDSSLNIMVEDNGKGFNQKKIKKSSGMGLHSIDKRIDHLNGTLNIESEIEKGTTIIIDIPI